MDLRGLSFTVSVSVVMSWVSPAGADTGEKRPTYMEEVVVTAEKAGQQTIAPVEGARIYSGKKTSVIDLDGPPPIVNDNYRQVFQKTPGLLLSEESTPLLSLGYRGLQPHRAQFTQVLKDGIPIHADMFGYPEAYYTPPLQSVERVEFIRAGAALMYGPQPGGALNYVTRQPYADSPMLVTAENSVGSFGLYSNYTALSGTQGPLGYYGYFHHKRSQGFREHNSQVELFSGGSKFSFTMEEGALLTVVLDGYREKHGEPGGLTRKDFDAGSKKTNRMNDRFRLDRYAGALFLEKQMTPYSFLELKAFGGYYERQSWRQRASGVNFGVPPSGPNAETNSFENQRFFTGGVEARTRLDYEAFGQYENTLTAGILYYHVTSPRVDRRGMTADAGTGPVRKDSDRRMNYVSLFAENLFNFGKLSVTPGVRLENIWQSVREKKNLDKTTVPLAEDSIYTLVPLFGVGAVYELPLDLEVYGNISQGYRPKMYTQAVPTGAGQVVNEDLKEGRSWQTDTGIRVAIGDVFFADAGFFYMEFNDQIGTTGVTVENMGDTRHYGFELAAEIDPVGILDRINGTDHRKTIGSVNLFANLMLLNAEFTRGPNKGKSPQYAPDRIFKTGMEYSYRDRAKVTMAGTFVDSHFANDTNTHQFSIPSYRVWDLTGEVMLYKDMLSLFGGINNLFDERYFARVRGDGIDPAAPRNFYMGAKVVW